MDCLTQMALLDFMPLFTKLPWTVDLLAPFLKEIFERKAELIDANLVVLGACVLSESPQCFDIMNPLYIEHLAHTLKTKPSLGASCYYFFGKQKKTLQDMLRKPEGISLMKMFLETAFSAKETFLGSLE